MNKSSLSKNHRLQLLIIILFSIFCFGFDSVKSSIKTLFKGDIIYADHFNITSECLLESNIRKKLIYDISKNVSDIDIDNFKNRKHYAPENHCDRKPGIEHFGAFAQCLKYHRERIGESWIKLRDGQDIKEVIKILSRAIHAQQDFFSHSNFIELNEKEKKELLGCWTQYEPKDNPVKQEQISKDERCYANTLFSSALKITGYDHNGENKYAPPNDEYSHQENAKDNKEVIGYFAAREAAKNACINSIKDFFRLCELDNACIENSRKLFEY